MNVAELERLLDDAYLPGLGNRFKEMSAMAPDILRRVIAAERMAGEVRNILDRGYVSSCIDEEKPDHDSLLDALTAYEATK